MSDVKTLPDYPRGITFEQVWAAIMEDKEFQKKEARKIRKMQNEYARQIKESRLETDRQIKESRLETDRQIKESQIETNRQIKETQQEAALQIKDINKRFGEYSNRLGEISEYMVAPKLSEKFNEYGYNFSKACRNIKVTDHKNNIFYEVDFLVENHDKAVLVEVKTNLTLKDVDAHIERLEKNRKYADLRNDKRIFLGAVAGVVIPEDVREHALNNGFFVIEPSGETFNITQPNRNPKEW